jgi:Ser/Thr protein kinase RdoA (MazF antagonist)
LVLSFKKELLALPSLSCPSLSAPELTPVLARYPGLGKVRRVAWHSPRPFAASSIVACGGGLVFVKRHDPRVRNVDDLVEEHRFIAHLRARGCAVPDVLVTREGETALAGPGGSYEVHALAAGEDRYRDAPSWTPIAAAAEARQAGAALARLHCASAGFDAPARRTRLVVAGDWLWRADDPAGALDAWVAEDSLLRDALAGRAWRSDFARVLAPFYGVARGVAPPLWVHGDFHASNLLWGRDGVANVLDFGLCNRASAAFDLATAIERNAIAWLRLGDGDIGHAAIACALVQGYAEVAAVPQGVRAILPVVHVEFALSEVQYFHAVTGAMADVEAAYGDFLLGHAAWFAGPDGQRFLAQIS